MNERNNLPSSTTRVVGRRDVVDALHGEMRRSRLISIVGAGGIGKTTVALAVAERAIGELRDGVWLVDFAPLRDASLVPSAIASATGLTVHAGDVLAALCRYLRERETLLVLDNCEHMAAEIAACIGPILAEAPRVRLVTTSRVALDVAGEHVHRLAGLAHPASSSGLTAGEARAYPAIELFVERAGERLESFVLDDEGAPIVADICRSLDGIALAIELAAMRVDVFGLAGVRKELDDRFRLLAGRRGGLERHRTLAATLEWSYDLLAANEAHVLRAVSVFAGAFRLDGAAIVADVAEAEATTILARLAGSSLLSVETDPAGTTYRPLETTRAYCLERLAGTDDEPRMRRRHAEHVAAVLERASTEWEQLRSRDWGAVYGLLRDDLRAALAWTGALATQRDLRIRLTAAGIRLWNHLSMTDESRHHLTRALADIVDAGLEGTALEMNLQLALAGAILYTRGVVPEARVAMRRALAISERLDDTDFRLRCLRLISTYELFGGEPDAGIRTLESFLSLASAEDPTAMAEGETHLGVGEIFVGRLEDARRRMERLRAERSQDFNDTRFARFQYSNSVNELVVLCHAQWLTGSPDAAARSADLTLEYAREARHELSSSIALAWVCLVDLWLGRQAEAERHADALDELVERHGIVTWRPIVSFVRGALATLRHAGSDEGPRILERAITEFRATGHRARLPYYLAVLAEALGKHGRLAEAETTAGEAAALAVAQNERWCLPEILRIQAGIHAARGEHREAESLLRQAIAYADDIGARAWRGRAEAELVKMPRPGST